MSTPPKTDKAMEKLPKIIGWLAVLFTAVGPLHGQANATLSNPSACGLDLPLRDLTCPENINFYDPDVFHIVVGSAPGAALGTDVYLSEVRILLEHAWVSDVNISLRSPGGQTAVLLANTGGNEDNLGDTSLVACSGAMRLQLAACTPISAGTPPFTDGPYRADDDFYIFNDGVTDPTSGVWELLICDDLVDDTGVLQYVELIFEPLNCLPVQDVALVNVDSTTVTLSYEPQVLCGPSVLEIGPPGFTPGLDSFPGAGGQVFYVDCPPFDLSGLIEDTDYDVYLRRICGAGSSFSANSCGLRVQTGCSPALPTVTETFDNQDDCFAFCSVICTQTGFWRNVEGDAFDWITYSSNTPTLVGTGPSDDVTGGGKYVYLEANGSQCATGTSAYLYSGCLLLDQSGSDSCHLSFNYHMYGINIGELKLEASDDGGLSWSELWAESGNQGNQWNKAYVGLGGYPDGSELILRFVGEKGFGIYGDIALDQIVLHGSQWLGFADQLLYIDNDGDGYGEDGIPIPSCLSMPPLGLALNNLDCNDNDPLINPEASEIPCNSIDENCNATTIDDDGVLPPPPTTGDTICSGGLPVLLAEADPGFNLFWYANPDRSGGIIWFGSTYSPNLPANNSPFIESYTFYVEVSNFDCSSPNLAPVTAWVLPRPAGVVSDEPEICPGEMVDLASIPISDQNFTGAIITYHSESPANGANQLPSTTVQPTNTTDYIYLMTSQDGCTFEDTLTIFRKAGPDILFSPADSFSLCREVIDTVFASASGSPAPYDYFWENGRTDAFLPVQGDFVAGTQVSYALTVTDAEGCFAVDSVLLTTTNSIDSARVFTTPVSTCEGSDGMIEIIPLNGQAPYAYSWESEAGATGGGSNILDTIRISDLPQNAYRVTITDTSPEACEIQLRNIRVQGPGFQLGETDLSPPTCAGMTDGQICLDVSGSNSLTYGWSDGQSTACANSLAAGTYSVTISNGECTTSETYILQEPDSLSVVATLQQPSCHNTVDGSIQLQVFGGTPNYEFQWDDGPIVPNRSNLVMGSYPVTITDAQACLLFETIVLPAPDPLSFIIDTIATVSCFGTTDGLVLVGAVGGTPPYRYQWADGPTTPFRFDLAPGTYSVVITDFQDCQTTGLVSIGEPDPLSLSVTNSTAPICFGDETGTIQLQAQGGTPPYEYQWSDGFTASSPMRTDLGVATYTITLVDAEGCMSDPLVFDLEPESNLQISAIITAPQCIGATDGAISVSTGGVEPITYHWSTGATSSTLTNIGVGIYDLTVSDDRGCLADSSFTISSSQVFNITSAVAQPSCFGVDDGIIDQSFSTLPTGSFSFSWSDGSQHVDRFFLNPGEYSFTVTEDGTNCQFYSDTFNLTYPEPLSISIQDSGGIACAGDTTGYFETSAEGGTTPYNYNWIGTGVTTANIYNLEAGEHRLSVTDDRGCTIDTLLALTDPNPLDVFAELVLGDLCDPASFDELTGSATGGLPPYDYRWSNGDTTSVIQNPSAGDYFLTVTDALGCAQVFGTVKVQARPEALQLTDFAVEGVSCFGNTDASMTAQVSGGSGRLLYHFTPTYLDTTNVDSLTVSDLPHALSYSVTITDVTTGCIVESEVVEVEQPMPLSVSRDSIDLISCFGGVDGAIYISANGGTAPYDFSWYDADTTLISQEEDLLFVAEGIYTVVVIDENLCSTQLVDSNVVSQHELITVADTVITAVACRGEATGGIDLTIGGGSPPFVYEWSNGVMNEDLINVPAGNYAVTLTDSDTCRAIFQGFQVPQPSTTLEVASVVDSVLCFGDEDGRIELLVSGGGAPYTYQWRRNGMLWPSADGPIIEALYPAIYEVTIEDTNNCVRQLEYDLAEPAQIIVAILNQPQGSDSLSMMASGGMDPYELLWSTMDTTSTIRMLESGMYAITVTDANGCTGDASFLLTGDGAPIPSDRLIRLFPNPSDGLIRVESEKDFPAGTRYDIYAADGRLTERRYLKTATSQIEIDLRNLPANWYNLTISLPDGKQEHLRFIIQR